MGLDMFLCSIKKDVFYSVDRDDFWEIEHEKSEKIIEWRKEYFIDLWFYENSKFYDICTEEITKEKLINFVEFLKDTGKDVYIKEINKLIKENDFDNNVIYYKHYN